MSDVLAAHPASRWREELEVPPDLLLGDLPARAAARWPDRTAIRDSQGATVSFAELAAATEALAAAIPALAPRPGDVVAVSMALDPVTAAAYFAVARSGRVVAAVNPLMPDGALRHILTATGARAALVTPAIAERLARMGGDLPDLTTVVAVHGPVGGLAQLLGARPEVATPAPRADADDVAGIQFTSGTTGAPKAVRLSHRNLVVNAFQSAQGQELDEHAIVLNHLPLYHLMHLGAGLASAATQVLCAADDPVDAATMAAEVGATHLFSLPVRLARLASDARLDGIDLRELRLVGSGGSALPATTAVELAERLHVPVIQGFGLAEASPLTHEGLAGRPRPGSVGPPLWGTEARVVDADTGCPVGPRERGALEVRGPQVMLGYVGEADGAQLHDGWLPTGDIGWVDDDDHLYVVDRAKDVFKCDGEMVSPSELERLLRAQPGIADCAVFDWPDGPGSAVPYGLIVADEQAPPALADLAAVVNADLPEPHRLRRLALVPSLGRSANGKLVRRALREAAADGGGRPPEATDVWPV